jgi:PPOX class probable F420-dependent enzyme
MTRSARVYSFVLARVSRQYGYGMAMASSSKSPFSRVTDFVYTRMRHKDAWSVSDAEPVTGFASLADHKYALLVTYRRDGRGVPTPVWFGCDERDRVYFDTEEAAGKVKRIRNNPQVRLAPCDLRGKPLGPPAVGVARILDRDDAEHAEHTIAANYGLGRRLYQGASERLPVSIAYVEVQPKP